MGLRRIEFTDRIVFLTIAFLAMKLIWRDYLQPRCDDDTDIIHIPEENVAHRIHSDMPIIFLLGFPFSGKTLMRVLLDAHPDVRCTEDPDVIGQSMAIRGGVATMEVEKERLQEAGVYDVYDSALTTLILQILVRGGHGPLKERLCLAVQSSNPIKFDLLHPMFPKSKFLLMVRDGRAAAWSGFTSEGSFESFMYLLLFGQNIGNWNSNAKMLYKACVAIGEEWCMMVRYEDLVLYPKKTLQKVLSFVDLPWNDRVLNHHLYVNQKDGIFISKNDSHLKQLSRPINLLSLNRWVPNKQGDLQSVIRKAPMMKTMGYDVYENEMPTDDAEDIVKSNTKKLQEDGVTV